MNRIFKYLEIASVSIICMFALSIKCNAATTINLSSLDEDQEYYLNGDIIFNLDTNKTMKRVYVEGNLKITGTGTLTLQSQYHTDAGISSYPGPTILESGNIITNGTLSGSYIVNGGTIRGIELGGFMDSNENGYLTVNGGNIEVNDIFICGTNASININGGHVIAKSSLQAANINIANNMFVTDPWNAVPEVGLNDTTTHEKMKVIWAAYATESKVCIIPKSEIVFVKGVSFSNQSGTYNKGDIIKLEANTIPANATNQKIKYVIDNSEVGYVSYDNNLYIYEYGEAVVTATTEDGGFVATYRVNVPDTRSSLDDATMKLNNSVFKYDGSEKKPSVVVTLNGKILKEGDDYALSYVNNIDVGTAKVTATGINSYKGSITETYSIVSNEENAQDGNSTSPAKEPDSSSNPDNTKEESNDGGNDSTTQEESEQINYKQKTTNVSKIKAKKKSISITWKKQTAKGIKGYEIQYSTDKDFNEDATKTITIKKVKTTDITIKKLKSKTKYYVRVRTFSKKNGEKVYSKWSKTKSVKIK